MIASPAPASRYLIVSNRLPVTVSQKEGKIELKASAGGLATALSHVHGTEGSRWIGWPGETGQMDKSARAELDRRLNADGMIPVHLTTKQVERFYEGFCNGVLWPLFHYLLDKVRLDAWVDWQAYREANELFADAVARHYQPGDRIWVHDYHLMLLPALLRKRLPHASISFFLHIPFPASGVFRILPWRREILEGLLGCDLIGFHTHSYQRQFLSSLLRLLGLETQVDSVTYDGRMVRVGAFPISIDTEHFIKESSTPRVEEAAAKMREQNTECKILFGVDRLDYTKGMRRRVLAIERLLERSPGLAGKFRLIQVASPSRTKVEAYAQLRRSLDELVGRVNGRFSTVNWSPVQYLYQTMSLEDLMPLYRAADVMVVTPTRDGMNLVAKEFVACRNDNDGVLVLSEFTGAAWELGEAVLVNPYDIDGIARALQQAITMPEEERHFRMTRLRQRIQRWTVHDWVKSFDAAFAQVTSENERLRQSTVLPPEEVLRMKNAEHLVLVLDYDGTLVPYAGLPELAAPDKELYELLEALIAKPNIELHIASGRPRETMERWFGGLDAALHADHGFWKRARGATEWTTMGSLEAGWKEKAKVIMEEFAARTPGSFVEEKTVALCWHFRLCESQFAELQERELRLHLADLFKNHPVEVMRGNKIVELRQLGIHKGLIVSALSAAGPEDALLVAVGDDTTDEDMFRQMPPDGISIHSGSLASRARYRLAGPAAVRAVLRQLVEG
ncbi:bifunctional alpha,alpha-trehalose-phosphate synthase (UDP-forming)/trehalose-phosphatase [Brevifollis gellanilyticus]|uniref:Alpha,alpha-trehalose-phosphate synthase n=1 Tax=Brevifollis gellanilyticus TaxID=748831 RepID=A0A512M5H6_9BACT|nr:bifunctional alpha,alpha-trehalose-phosphate synthase (UDP-forming)/trehalose-phosphatase [Brevifollis gellanilyticus]GEP41987.1 bifunctional alpha,alpha-trehalose-phosphate synthase (UDP-forming)/trehalose-phosphatase [Brevifollis gellanilyticus]